VVYGGTLTGSVSAPHETVTRDGVIDFAAAQSTLTNSSAFWFTLTPTCSTVLVNTDGTVNDFDNLGINNDSTGITTKRKVLYNFHQATSLSISGISVQGSILAPHAAATFGNGNIEGTAAVRLTTTCFPATSRLRCRNLHR
jgi:hypothetical protein